MTLGVDELHRIQSDLRCVSCGYNLRTLERAGRCPECGTPVSASIRAQQWKQRTLDQAEPEWLRQLLEGASLALAVWFIVLALALLPQEFVHWLSRRHSPQRAWLLGVTCVWWTWSWAAVWKLSRRESDLESLASPWHTALVIAVRAAVTVYLAMPMLFAWGGPLPSRAVQVLALGMFGCGSLAGLALWARVWLLAGLGRRRAIGAQALVLMITSPVALWLALFQGHSGWSSLDFMFHLPLPGLGWPLAVGLVVGGYDLPEHWMERFVLFHASLVFAALIQLLVMLMVARRRALANVRERSETSSIP